MSDLQQQVEQLRELLAGASLRIGVQVSQLSAWAGDLPPRHVPVPDPVRLADLATEDLTSPLSLARRVRELARLLARADALGQTLMDTVAVDSPLFAPPGTMNPDPGADEPAVPALQEDEVSQAQVSLIGQCASAWGEDDAFERQRQAVRRVMTFDGNRTWHGTLTASISADLPGWQNVLEAVEAGAYIEIQAVPTWGSSTRRGGE